MNNYRFVYDFKDNVSLRQSLNRLTLQTFGFSFEHWYQQGYWSDVCIPYAYLDNGEVIASLTANKMELIINGQRRKALQIGTVITHPDYRHQGLSAALIDKVLESYEKAYDFIYLFANQTVLDFYPKLGFKRVAMTGFELSTQDIHGESKHGNIRRLSMANSGDIALIEKIVAQRRPISQVFSAVNAEKLFMFYAVNIFPDDLYLLESEEILIISHRENEVLNLYDIVSSEPIDFSRILPWILEDGIERIVFHFTPDQLNLDVREISWDHEDVLFVKGTGFSIDRSFNSPITAHT